MCKVDSRIKISKRNDAAKVLKCKVLRGGDNFNKK